MEYPRRKNFSVIYMRTVLSLSLLLFGIGACSFVNVCMHNPCDVSAIAGTLISLAVELAILRWAVRAWFGGWVASGVLVTRRGWFPVNAYSGIIYKREFESHFQDCGRECFIGFDGKVRSVRLVDKRNGNMMYYIGAILDENYTMRVDKAEILDRVIRSFINKRSFESTRQFWGLRIETNAKGAWPHLTMKQRMVVLIVVAFGFFAVCYVPSGCASAERRVRIFDVNNGYVKEVRNAVPGFTREIAECSPDRLNNTFSTLQNARFCGDAKCRSTIRVYDTNATLRCTSFVPFPDGVYLSPRQFSVCSGKIIFWNSRFSAKGWVGTNELCVATLCDKNSITGVKRIAMPSGCSSVLDWEESFMWSTPTSIVVNVMFERQLTKRIAIVDAVSGDIRFLSFDVRAGGSLLSSFQCSFSRRFFAVVTRKGEVLICDGQGNVRNSISMGHLQTLGLCEVTDLDLEDESLSICWDDGDVLWIFNANGRYVCKDIETNSVIKNGSFSLGMGEKLVGFIQGSRAVIKQKRSPEIIRSIWGNHFYVKDIDTGNHFAEMPNFVSRYTYLGDGLILLEDL